METLKEFLVFPLDYKKKIAFLSTKDVKRSWTYDIDWSFPVNESKPKMFKENGKEENVKSREAENQGTELCFQNIAVSGAHDLLAFTTTNKSLFLCKISESSAVVLSRRVFLRTVSTIKFSSCGKFLFLSDKTGDTFEYSCEDVDKPARWIFGHISQILDLQIKSDLSYIVTSDRDEKIRVTHYPDVHEISAFCIGHKEYVSSAVFFNNESLLLSASGDKTLRFWNFEDGKQVQLINLHFVPVVLELSEVSDSKGVMGISSDDNSIYVYSYQIVSADAVKIHLLGQKSYSGDFDFAFQDKTIFVKHIQEADGKRKLMVDKVTISAHSASFESFADVNQVASITLEPDFKIFKPFDVSLLFKKKFDNVKQYIDRKKARIENLQTKKLRK